MFEWWMVIVIAIATGIYAEWRWREGFSAALKQGYDLGYELGFREGVDTSKKFIEQFHKEVENIIKEGEKKKNETT